jgi:hypothetical protein
MPSSGAVAAAWAGGSWQGELLVLEIHTAQSEKQKKGSRAANALPPYAHALAQVHLKSAAAGGAPAWKSRFGVVQHGWLTVFADSESALQPLARFPITPACSVRRLVPTRSTFEGANSEALAASAAYAAETSELFQHFDSEQGDAVAMDEDEKAEAAAAGAVGGSSLPAGVFPGDVIELVTPTVPMLLAVPPGEVEARGRGGAKLGGGSDAAAQAAKKKKSRRAAKSAATGAWVHALASVIGSSEASDADPVHLAWSRRSDEYFTVLITEPQNGLASNGIVLTRRRGWAVVSAVTNPALRAHIPLGSALDSINDEPVMLWSYGQIQEALQELQAEVQALLERRAEAEASGFGLPGDQEDVLLELELRFRAPPEHCGALAKLPRALAAKVQGGGRKGDAVPLKKWSARYFELSRGNLRYYADEETAAATAAYEKPAIELDMEARALEEEAAEAEAEAQDAAAESELRVASAELEERAAQADAAAKAKARAAKAAREKAKAAAEQTKPSIMVPGKKGANMVAKSMYYELPLEGAAVALLTPDEAGGRVHCLQIVHRDVHAGHDKMVLAAEDEGQQLEWAGALYHAVAVANGGGHIVQQAMAALQTEVEEWQGVAAEAEEQLQAAEEQADDEGVARFEDRLTNAETEMEAAAIALRYAKEAQSHIMSEHVHRTDGSHGKKKSHAAMLAAATGDFGDLFTADTDEDSDDLGSDADGAKPLDDDELDDLVERLDMQAHAAGHAGGELDWQGESGRARDAAASMTRDGSFLVAAKGLMQHAGGGPLSIGLKGLVSGFAEGGAAEDALQKARENAADAAAASVMAAYHADNEGGGSDEDEDDCVVEDCLVGILVKRAMKVRQGERGP